MAALLLSERKELKSYGVKESCGQGNGTGD